MKYLHSTFTGGGEKCISVTLDKQAEVLLLDNNNYNSFRNGSNYRGFGGLAVKSPIVMRPPHLGTWHVVVLPRFGSTVRANILVS